MSHRIFIAINLPENIKNEIEALILELKKKNKRATVKWVERENLHLTLHFLGSITDEQIETIKLILEKRAMESGPIELEMGLVGAFPNLQEPRVVFIDAKEKTGQLVRLVKNIGQDLINQGFEVDNRPWQSHITIGRIKNQSGKLEGIDHEYIIGKIWPAKSIDLMESELTSDGPNYKIVASYKL